MVNNNLSHQWDATLALVQSNIDEKEYRTWFSELRAISYKEGVLTLGAPNNVMIDYLRKNHQPMLLGFVSQVFDAGAKINWTRYEVKADAPIKKPSEILKPRTEASTLNSNLNSELTMESYVKGKANKLAVTIAKSIAMKPGQLVFNPFFLYGASGVGKTHLINAIGLEVKRTMPHLNVLYVPAHVFKTQFMNATKKNVQNDFLHFYQSIDVLIVDDIQEFQTKGTQQAFFHIFNYLQRNYRQIIISSDRPPATIEGFEERMLTRFKAGVMAEIERPDVALRRAIIKSKIVRDGLVFPRECIDYIVTNVDSSVRELQGIINSIMAFSVADGNCNITLELTERVVARAINLERQQITIDSILRTVCKHFGITTRDVLSKSRKQGIVQARQVAMYLSHKYTQKSYAEIGRQLGKKDHSTVLHSCDVTATRISTDTNFRHEVEGIEASFG